MNADRLARLRTQVLAGDDTACFCEREAIIELHHHAWSELTGPERQDAALAVLLRDLGTPIGPDDALLGRMAEGPAPLPLARISGGGWSHPADPFAAPRTAPMRGHRTPDYAGMVEHGLAGLPARPAWSKAISAFARRYAHAARARAADDAGEGRHRLLRAAAALERVPDQPPRSLFEALQGIWLVHLVLSAVVGGRDFAFGRLDQYLLPLYRRDLAEGRLTRGQAVELVADLLLKTNEITGTASVFHASKPIPCAASKQYLVLAGTLPGGSPAENELSQVVLEAARLVRLPQPDLFVRRSPAAARSWGLAVMAAVRELQGQVQCINDAVAIPALVAAGLPEQAATGYTLSGCCRIDLPGQAADETYHDCTAWLVEALGYGPMQPGHPPATLDEALDRLEAIARRQAASAATEVPPPTDGPGSDLLASAAGPRLHCHFLSGIATIADSLAAIEEVVVRQRRHSLPEFLGIVAAGFAGQPALLGELHRLPGFGNDAGPAEAWAERAGRILVDAVGALRQPQRIHVAGFFSLVRHREFGRPLPATPDGRPAGAAVSENQSPAPGRDRAGPTALLRSLARLPFRRAPAGGLNLRLVPPVADEQLLALSEAYFALGGQHLGLTLLDRATLEEARRDPASHAGLCVRVTGFSEYFARLAPVQQQEVIERSDGRLGNGSP